jgi:hypothetical protein
VLSKPSIAEFAEKGRRVRRGVGGYMVEELEQEYTALKDKVRDLREYL